MMQLRKIRRFINEEWQMVAIVIVWIAMCAGFMWYVTTHQPVTPAKGLNDIVELPVWVVLLLLILALRK